MTDLTTTRLLNNKNYNTIKLQVDFDLAELQVDYE